MCRPGDNEELRYSIRSVIANFESLNNIWLIGDKPDWYVGNFVKTHPVGNAYENVRNNLKHVIDTPEISENFILMNDDFFISEKQKSVSLYHGGLLINRSQRHQELAGPNYYATFLMKTDTVLKKMGIKNPLNYELHTPMEFNKQLLAQTIDLPISIRSAYGNIHSIGGEEIKDVKIYSHPCFVVDSSSIDNGTEYFSTEDGAFANIKYIVEEMFPLSSQYESN